MPGQALWVSVHWTTPLRRSSATDSAAIACLPSRRSLARTASALRRRPRLLRGTVDVVEALTEGALGDER
jgi:hypothetical protein